ncbi:restriction endonuclease subunit S [Streptomyces sp. NPDC058682]|uniref:restriction endonuclease subunit S n=1 Tax=Streptomyces sp. NPDC058682 TaxID=3346596 RepID=UPI003666F098
MTRREETELGSILTVHHGFAFAGEGMTDELTGNPVLVSIGNFDYGGGFRFESTRVREFRGDYPTQFELNPGDLVVVMTCQTSGGEILGLPGLIPDDGKTYLHNQRIGRVECTPDRLDKRFAYYLFLSPEVNRQLFATATGTKILHTSPGRIGRVTLALPEVSEQVAIARVLGALDDKIAVNAKISATAVRLTDTLFAQHAGHLEFGEETFGSVASIMGGGTPSTKIDDFWGGQISWSTPSDVTALPSPYLFATSRNITEFGLENCNSQLYPAQSIFMTSRATIGAFALSQVPAAVNQGFIVVLPPNEEMRWWLLHEMRSRVDEMISLANGSIFLELSRKNFKAMQIRLPGPAEVAEFARKVAPLHAAAAHAADENRTLAALRDTLLPQLMSGRLRVRDAETIVEDHV